MFNVFKNHPPIIEEAKKLNSSLLFHLAAYFCWYFCYINGTSSSSCCL